MQIKEVITTNDKKAFLQIAVTCNAQNPKWIRPLDKDIEQIFDTKKNKAFKYGNCIRWIIQDNEKKPIGRIAAFTSKKYFNKGDDFSVGGIGLFECIDNQAIANLLFDTAKIWLQNQGVQAMDGPINFLDRDKFWGLLIEGFDEEPIYGMSFNPPYYQKLFENYGFQNFYNQYYYGMQVSDVLPEKFAERHARFASKPDYSAIHANKKQLNKFAIDFCTIYNAAWAQHDGGKEMTNEQAIKVFNTMKPIIDETLVWFAYYKDSPIACWINIPDLNQYFKYFNGKLGWLQKIHLLWMKYTKKCKRFTGIAFGVIPKFQAMGIDSFMIYEGAKMIQKKQTYNMYEMGWAADWNPKMVNIYKSLGAQQTRRLITYRYIFDKNIPFKHHPIIEYKTKV